jgi:5-methylcytosine-specific restriction protein A
MPHAPKKVNRPWVKEHAAFERDRTNEFDYNGRKWRNLRAQFLNANPLCCDCEAEGLVVPATVADHNPQAKVLMAQGLDPYDVQYLQPRCKKHHDSKSGRERHTGGMGSNL